MSASALMSIGIRAMAANYAALQTSGHNIANANVKGYSRQQVDLATAKGQFSGAGFFGKGVDVATVSRLHNEFLTRESDAAAALSAMDATRLTHLRRVENVFQPGDTGLGAAVSDLFAALSDMGSNPSDLATRQVVLARAEDLASRFAAAGAALDEVQAGITAELETSVTQINTLASGIAEANQRIAALKGLGQPANDLLDERERLIAQLSEQVNVTRIEADDGTMAIFIGGGQRLVLGHNAEQLSIVRDPVDGTRSAVAIRDGAALRVVDHKTVGGGKVAGLLGVQNDDLGTGRNLVGQLALAVGGALNAQQLAGANLMPPLGTVASRALFTFGASDGQAHAGNARDPMGNPIGSATLTIADPAVVGIHDYELFESTTVPGAWTLRRLPDGFDRTVNSGDTVDGVTINVVNAQPGDHFLLQPTARVANGMKTVLRDPRELAAASPLLATTPPSVTHPLPNVGTAAVAGLRVTATPLPFPGATDTLTFTQLVPPVNVAGKDWHYEYTSSLGGGPTYWNAGDPLVGGNGYTLTLAGSPATGDAIDVAPTPASALLSNNGNALSLVALRDAALVGGHGYADAWSQALAEIGVRAQSADVTSTMSAAVAAQAEQARSSASGVNLDEEAARLIQFQQSYQAAAKVLQIAQSLFDSLLHATAG